ncbi:hypothetical protein BB561_001294 [Smittium simulii]|uniref:Ribosomal protein L7/L12 C-terminal domain-containing protein n=1 Tax=Smittium simulii TaxID=133385 RepID=A0A2T9YV84_9FUNG|nr:hypothetical protein BB561_001294 [Smittium simulii]
MFARTLSKAIRPQTFGFVSKSKLHSSAFLRNDTLPVPDPSKTSVSPKIEAIVNDISKLTLLETSTLVQELKIRLNITEAVHVAAAAPANNSANSEPAEEKPVEKTEYTVKLDKFDPNQKAKIIREIKSILPDLNLIAAKKFVEGAPKVIKENIPKADAEKIKATLEALGATIVME